MPVLHRAKRLNLAGLQTSNIFIPNQKLKNAFKKQLDAAGYSQLNAVKMSFFVYKFKK